jgi:hypothetical protein
MLIMDGEKAFEEWKVTRSTIVEFDRILLNIRALDVTATTVLLGTGFQYSHWLFLFAVVLNISFFFLESHYHRYLHAVANHAISIENKIGFNLTKVIDSSRNKYKNENKTSMSFWWGLAIANIYYIIYVGFMIIGLILFFVR